MRKMLFVCIALALLVFLAGCPLQPPPPQPQPTENWGESQVKLTWVGPQRKTISSMAISVAEYKPEKFGAYASEKLDYSNDRKALERFVVSEERMKGVVEASYALAFISKDAGMPAEPMLSFAHYNGTSGKTSERVLDIGQARALSAKLREQMKDDGKAVQILNGYG